MAGRHGRGKSPAANLSPVLVPALLVDLSPLQGCTHPVISGLLWSCPLQNSCWLQRPGQRVQVWVSVCLENDAPGEWR